MRLRILALVLMGLVLGCGGATGGKVKAPARELPDDVGSVLARARDMYGADKAAMAYAAEHAALIKHFEEGLPDEVRKLVKHEPALDLVAEVLSAVYVRTEQEPAPSLERWLFWRCGSVSVPGAFNVFAFGGEGDALPHFESHLKEVASRLPTRSGPLSYGIVRASWGHVTAQGIMIGRRPVEVAALKKSYAPGQTLEIAATPTGGHTNLTLYVDAGGGDVTVVPMTAGADGTFFAKAPLPQKPGRYFVEVLGVEPKSHAVDPDHPFRNMLMLAPVYVGVAEPKTPDEFIRRPAPNPPDPATWKQRIVTAYNVERARYGRPPLALDPRVDGIAQRKSDEVAASPGDIRPDPQVVQEIMASGIAVDDMLNSIDHLEYISEYVNLRLLRPAARHHLLSPTAQLMGVGISQRHNHATASRPYAVVEYAVEVVKPMDVAKEKDRVYAALGELEKVDGKKPLDRDDGLGKVAQEIAEAVCKGTRKPDDGKGIWEKAGLGPAKGFMKRGSYSWMGYHLTNEALAKMRNDMKAGGYTKVAVGLCQGNFEGRPMASYMLLLEMGP